MKKLKLLTTLLPLILSSCSANFMGLNFSSDPKDQRLSSFEIQKVKTSGLVDINNNISTKLFKNILKNKSKENIFVSGLNTSLLLQMIYNGSVNETKDLIGNFLGVKSFDLDMLNQTNQLLIRKLNNPANDINLTLANSIWINKNFSFGTGFTKIINDDYFVDTIKNIDFTSLDTNKSVNKWIKEKTNDKIPQIVNEAEPLSKNPENFADKIDMIFSALYFKADWNIKFNPDEDTMDKFNLADGSQKSVKMMNRNGGFYYTNYMVGDDKVEVGIMDYGQDKNLKMYIIMPNQKTDLNLVLDGMDKDFFDNVQYLHTSLGKISIPKFKINSNLDVSENLKDLGLNEIFTHSGAQLDKMYGDDVNSPDNIGKYSSTDTHFDSMIINSEIDVNENGTTALSQGVTSNSSYPSAPPPRDNFYANKPFIFLIRDEDTKTNLFMGRVTNPESN